MKGLKLYLIFVFLLPHSGCDQLETYQEYSPSIEQTSEPVLSEDGNSGEAFQPSSEESLSESPPMQEEPPRIYNPPDIEEAHLTDDFAAPNDDSATPAPLLTATDTLPFSTFHENAPVVQEPEYVPPSEENSTEMPDHVLTATETVPFATLHEDAPSATPFESAPEQTQSSQIPPDGQEEHPLAELADLREQKEQKPAPMNLNEEATETLYIETEAIDNSSEQQLSSEEWSFPTEEVVQEPQSFIPAEQNEQQDHINPENPEEPMDSSEESIILGHFSSPLAERTDTVLHSGYSETPRTEEVQFTGGDAVNSFATPEAEQVEENVESVVPGTFSDQLEPELPAFLPPSPNGFHHESSVSDGDFIAPQEETTRAAEPFEDVTGAPNEDPMEFIIIHEEPRPAEGDNVLNEEHGVPQFNENSEISQEWTDMPAQPNAEKFTVQSEDDSAIAGSDGTDSLVNEVMSAKYIEVVEEQGNLDQKVEKQAHPPEAVGEATPESTDGEQEERIETKQESASEAQAAGARPDWRFCDADGDCPDPRSEDSELVRHVIRSHSRSEKRKARLF